MAIDHHSTPAPDEATRAEIVRLYRGAFQRFRTIALWNMREHQNPTPWAALAIAHALRFEGNMESRRLAEKIEGLCRGGR